MSFPFIPMLLGAAGGALFNKKDPLTGALMGGGLGAAGGLLAPGGGFGGAAGQGGLLSNPLEHVGSAMTHGTNIGSQQTAMLAAQDAGMGANPMAQASEFMKPAGIAMQAADAVKPNPEQLPPPPVPQMPNFGGASQTLAQIAQQPQQMAMQQQQIDEAKKQRRMGLLSRMA